MGGKSNYPNSNQQCKVVFVYYWFCFQETESYTSEISALMFSIILIWSWGIFTEETPKEECVVSGTAGKLDVPASRMAALSLISVLEELEAGSSLTAFHRCINITRKQNH